jgi:tRNA-specific 2-thiouridylase
MEITAKTRYSQKKSPALLNIENGVANVKFYEPVRAITSGQAVVFYKDDIVLGGGTII